MVVEGLIRNDIQELLNSDELSSFIDDVSKRSATAKHWINNLIKPIFICLLFVRAEREGEWLLHLTSVKEMLLYFYAVGHHNYARYGSYYLRNMETLPCEVLEKFMKGKHLMRHQEGYWNGIWPDMFIEITFMRYGKGPGEIVGVPLQPNVVKKWTNSLHITTQILKDLDALREKARPMSQEFHKEELKGRRRSYEDNRAGIRKALEKCFNAFQRNLKGLVNIYSRYVANKEVNVHNSIKIGQEQQSKFQASCPDGFHSPIKNEIVTMKSSKKSVKAGEVEIFNAEVIYSRVMCLLSIGRIELEEVLKYELSPVPSSLFDSNGEMMHSTSKTDLKKQASNRNISTTSI